MLIAIAEDQERDREFLEDHLKRWGHDTETHAKGVAALHRLQDPAPPRVLLLSWEIPGLAALEVCRRLRELNLANRTHVVLIVGRNHFHEALEAVAAGLADDCLLRPLDAYALEARLAVARHSLALRARLDRTEVALADQALKDGATGLWSRDACLAFLRRELAGSRRDGSSLGAALLELEGLSEIERSRGFEAGTEALREVSERLRTAIRTTDWAGRFSERQLLVVLPGCGEARARSVAGRLAHLLKGALGEGVADPGTGVRYGAAAAEPGEEDVDRFMALVLEDLAASEEKTTAS